MTMEEMVATLNKWSHAYYTLDQPLVSDGEYDRLYDRLVQEEKETGRVLADSPSLRVGDKILEDFQKYTHRGQLYSLDKAQTFEALEAWESRNRKLLEEAGYQKEPGYVVELKFDGLTINVTYEDGILTHAATRGNGQVGEEILEQIRRIPSIPLSIDKRETLEIQGEGLMPLKALEDYNKTAQEPLKNARNAAAGALRNLDPNVVKERKLTAYFYNIGYKTGPGFSTDLEMKEEIRSLGLRVHPFIHLEKSLEGVFERINQVEGFRGDLDVLIDGVVVKINDMGARELLGFTNKFPRWAIAYKFAAKEATSILREVHWNVGRTGKVTPTAEFDPVDIEGVTIRRATLNNYDDILRKKVEIGARILLRRSNDVIPEIMGVLPSEGPKEKIQKPSHCPYCHAEIVQEGVHIFCPNSLSCQPQLLAKMKHFCSRGAMNIEGLSEKTLAKLMTEKNIRSIGDLYDLNFQDFRSMEGFGDKRSKQLIEAIEASKTPDLANFIFALGIGQVGAKGAQDLAQAFGSFEALRRASQEDILAVPDMGPVTARELVTFFHDPEIIKELDHLKASGVQVQDFKASQKEQIFAGKTFVLTGSLSRKRSQVEEEIRSLGGKTSSSVSKNTDYVLAGEKAGSKAQQAQKLGVAIISEEDYKEMLNKGVGK